MGADANGKIVAAEADLLYEAGAFPGSPVGAGAMCVFTCYDIANARVDGYDIVVNKPRTNAYRAPGGDECSVCRGDGRRRDLRAIEYLIRWSSGSRMRPGRDVPGGWPGLSANRDDRVGRSDSEERPLEEPSRRQEQGAGSGFRILVQLRIEIGGVGDSELGRKCEPDGRLDGHRGSCAGIAMQFAETLGIGAYDVRPTVGDTDAVGYNDITGGAA